MTQVGRLHTRLVLLQDGDDLGMPLALHPPQARDQRGKLSYNWKAKYTNEMRRDREERSRKRPNETDLESRKRSELSYSRGTRTQRSDCAARLPRYLRFD
jgi:hypothetical protein